MGCAPSTPAAAPVAAPPKAVSDDEMAAIKAKLAAWLERLISICISASLSLFSFMAERVAASDAAQHTLGEGA